MTRRHSTDTIRRFFRLVRSHGIQAASTSTKIPLRTGYRWVTLGEREVQRRNTVVSRIGWKQDQDAAIRQLLEAGVQQSEIARRLHLSRQRVSQIVRGRIRTAV